MVPTEDIPKDESLKEEIAELINKIKNTEYDLANMFRGNNTVKQKLEAHKKMLSEKEKLLISLKEDPNKNLVKTEEEMVENTLITPEQEKIIDKEVENQFTQ